jgi:RHS repeat-associated protein
MMKGVTTAVDPATQALTATVELSGTSHALVYRSDAVQGSAGATTVRVPIERDQLPKGTRRVDLMVSVDGVTDVRSFDPEELPLDCVISPFKLTEGHRPRMDVAVGYVLGETDLDPDPTARTLATLERRLRGAEGDALSTADPSDNWGPDVPVAETEAVYWTQTGGYVDRSPLEAGFGEWWLAARAPPMRTPGTEAEGSAPTNDDWTGANGTSFAVIWGEEGHVRHEFDANGAHRRTVDTLTGIAELTFEDAEGRLSAVVTATGETTRFERDETGDLVAVIAPGGQRTTVDVESGLLRRITSPGGNAVTFEYASGGLLTAVTDSVGRQTTFEYDDDGRVVGRTLPTGQRVDYVRTETETGHEVRRVGADFSEWVVTVERTALSGRRVSTRCCGQPPRIVSVDRETRYVEYPDGSVLLIDERPDPWTEGDATFPASVRFTTPEGVGTDIERERTVERHEDSQVRRASETVYVDGEQYRVVFDGDRKAMTSSTPTGRTWETELDEWGRETVTRLADLAPVRYEYDGDRVSAVIVGTEDARRFTFRYADDRTLREATDPVSRTYTFEYDVDANVVTEHLPGGRMTSYAYNAAGECVSVTPPGRQPHRFDWTATGLPAQYTPPGLGATDGASKANDDADDDRWEFEYDGEGQLVRAVTPDGSIDVERTDGRPTAFVHPGGRTDFGYDEFGTLETVTAPDQVEVAYERDGALPRVVAWGGPVTGRVETTYGPGLSVTATRVNDEPPVEISHDADGQVIGAGSISLDRAPTTGLLVGGRLDGTTDRWEYDSFADVRRHVVDQDEEVVHEASYERDALGRILTATVTTAAAITTVDYAYDEAGRLASVRENGDLVAKYEYDENGNRVQAKTPDGSVTADYDSRDRLLRYGDISFSYTARGVLQNRTDAEGTTTYDYDLLGNLRTVDLSDGCRIEYIIDGHNRRIGKRVDGDLVAGWLYDGDRPIAEVDADGTVRSRYVYATNGRTPDYLVHDGRRYRLVTDHLGSPLAVIDSETGEVVQRRTYDAFGVLVSDTSPELHPFGFAGGLYDPDTGLVRFGLRDYDPRVGRFTAPDPIGFAGGDTNLYAYALSDPVNNVDPTGLMPTPDTILDIGFGAYDLYQYAKCPSKENAFALALDGIGLALPGVTGLSQIFKNVDDIAKYLLKHPEMAKGVQEGLEWALKRADKLDGPAGKKLQEFLDAVKRRVSPKSPTSRKSLKPSELPNRSPALKDSQYHHDAVDARRRQSDAHYGTRSSKWDNAERADDGLTRKKHFPDGSEAQKALRKGKDAHVFEETVDPDALIDDVLKNGEYIGKDTKGYHRFGKSTGQPVGVRKQNGKSDVPLSYVEVKTKQMPDGTWKHHAVPRTKKPRSTEGRPIRKGADPRKISARSKEGFVGEVIETFGGNPTVSRGSNRQDLFRVRKTGHKYDHATASPLNIKHPSTNEVTGVKKVRWGSPSRKNTLKPGETPNRGVRYVDEKITNRNVKEMYKSTDDSPIDRLAQKQLDLAKRNGASEEELKRLQERLMPQNTNRIRTGGRGKTDGFERTPSKEEIDRMVPDTDRTVSDRMLSEETNETKRTVRRVHDAEQMGREENKESDDEESK